MNKMKLSLVVPCYNEEDNIRDFYHAAKHVFDAEEYEYEMIFINDGSKDKTQEALESVFNLHEACVVVETFSRNFGKEAAIYAGFQKATGDFITVIDADLQQRPETVARMVKILQDNEEDGTLTGEVKFILYKGDHYHLTVLSDWDENVFVDTNDVWDDGDRVGITIPPDAIRIVKITD